MKAGDVGEEDRESGQSSSEGDKMQVSLCDVSSEEFKNTWLTLKELHDIELRRLQGKITSLRKERLSDGRQTGSICRIKELTEQQRALKDTIHDLRGQLNTKVCDRCTVNETYRNTLQQEFYDIQQQNLKFIGELTAERNKLREENKQLLAKLKMKQREFHCSFSDSGDDFVPGSQTSESVISIRDPPPGPESYVAVKLITQTNTKQTKSSGKKKQPHSSKFQVPFYSQDVFEVPESPQEKISSNKSNPMAIRSGRQKSTSTVASASTVSPQTVYGFPDSGDDFVPGSQTSESVISIRDPPPGVESHVAVKLITQRNTKQMKSSGKKKQPHSSKFQVPFYSQDVFEVPESPQEKISSNRSNPMAIRSGRQKSTSTVASASTVSPQTVYGFPDSGDDFVPGSQTSESVISIRDPPPGPESYVAVKLITQRNTKQMKSSGKKKQPHSSKFQVPFYSQDVFEVPESPQEKISSNRSNPMAIRSGSQKSTSTVASASTVSPQTVYGFPDSGDDFVPGSQTSESVISIRDPPPGPESYVAVKLITQRNTKQMKSSGKKKQPHSSKFQVPFYSQDVFEVPESPQEKISSNRSNPMAIRSGSQKSTSTVASASTVSPQTVYGFPDSGDDFVPGSQTSESVISIRDPPPGLESYVAVKLITQRNTKQMKSSGKKKQPHSSKFQVPFYSQDVFEVPESPQEKISSNRSNPMAIRSDSQKSTSTVASASTVSPQTVYGFPDDSSLPDATLGHPQSKSIFTQRTSSQRISTPKREPETDFPQSLSSISPGEDLPTEILSETSEESVIDYSKSIFAPFTRRGENTTTLHLFPVDYASRSEVTRPSFGVFQVLMRESSSETPCSEQSTARKNTNGATGAAHDADKPQGET